MFRDLAAAVRGGGKVGSRLGSKLMLCGGWGGGGEVIEPVYLPRAVHSLLASGNQEQQCPLLFLRPLLSYISIRK